MKFDKFLRDKLCFVVVFVLAYATSISFLYAFKVDQSLCVALSVIAVISFFSSLSFDFLRKKKFYDKLKTNTANLDKVYLVTTTLETPEFYEGELLMETLYDMTKSMNEKVIEIETNMKEFKEYLELWIHEIKLPIASLELILHNEKQKDKKIYDQIRRIERNVEEMLYYSRMESSEKDYLIKKIDLANLIGKTILSFKDDFLYQKIELQVENIEGQVYTDAKWLEFILGQIIANAIKYKKEENSHITVRSREDEKNVILEIEDDGVGISKEDLPRVFEKSFTGQNGHHHAKSTGMGLYIIKKLLSKLGVIIKIDSIEGVYTRVTLFFPKNEFYEVTK